MNVYEKRGATAETMERDMEEMGVMTHIFRVKCVIEEKLDVRFRDGAGALSHKNHPFSEFYEQASAVSSIGVFAKFRVATKTNDNNSFAP